MSLITVTHARPQMGSLNRVTSKRYWVVLLKSGRGGQGSRLELYRSEDQRGGLLRTISLDSVSVSFWPPCPHSLLLSSSLSLPLTHSSFYHHHSLFNLSSSPLPHSLSFSLSLSLSLSLSCLSLPPPPSLPPTSIFLSLSWSLT